MIIKLQVGGIQNEPAELIVLGLFEDQIGLGQAGAAVDQTLGGQIAQLIADGDFARKGKELSLLYAAGRGAAKRILLVGLGQEGKLSPESIRVAAGLAAKRVLGLGVRKYSTEVFGAGLGKVSLAEAVQAVVEGTGLALYEFTELKSGTDSDRKRIEELTIVVADASSLKEAEAGLAAGKAIVAGTSLTRDLVNWPGNFATPTFLAKQAQKLAESTSLTCLVLEEAAIRTLKMGGLLGVSEGSSQPPKFIVLEHNAKRADLDTIVLVGKGVTFDSGGISIKPADNMDRMRGDMAGGAAVMGAMLAVSTLALPLHVVALVPATENMPDGRALRPGDVLRVMNGKTVEVINTDAEGRLILADALCYAARYDPRAVVDIATLTGARTVALGDQAIGLFSNDDGLVERFVAAGHQTWERVWRLPLFEEYEEKLKSFAADMKNTGGRDGGACIAAAFLNQFVTYPWVHLDVAGLVSSETERPYTPTWATGLGARLLTQFLRDWAETRPELLKTAH
jgi:leucyl aminopeptidase